MCLYSKYSNFCREFIFVLKQQEKILTSRRATGGLQALTATLTLALTLTLTLTLTLGLTLIKTEYWDRAGGGGNISYEW